MAKKNALKASSISPASTGSDRNRPSVCTAVVPEEVPKEAEEEGVDKFQPSGEFEKDVVELCARMGIPSMKVVRRPRCPTAPVLSPPETSLGKAKDDKKNAASQMSELANPGERGEVAATTFTTCENSFDYLKPKIEVELEEDAGKPYVKEIFARGWKFDKRMIDVLAITMFELDRITSIDLWNAGLTDETLSSLASCLAQISTLRTLKLDGNCNTEEQNFQVFLTENSSIQNLSLRSCLLNDLCAERFGLALADNKNLLTLNLCFNKITSVGAKHLASGLRLNRVLLSLNLASNLIDDAGATKIAEVLGTFALTHDEVVTRRYLTSKVSADDLLLSHLATSPSTGERSPSAMKSFSKKAATPTKKKEAATAGRGKDAVAGAAVKRGPSFTDAAKAAVKGPKTKAAAKPDRSRTPQQDAEDLFEFKNPVLEKAKEINGELWVPGNRSLINLNLSRNHIGETGLIALHAAMKFQLDFAAENNRTAATGLMKLSLQNNDFPADHPTFVMLMDLMATRDPFYKAPSPSPIEEEAES